MMTQSPPIVSLSAPKDVLVAEIERELDRIWQNDRDGDTRSKIVAIKPNTYNLLVYEPEPIQHILAALGFYDGPIDGISGPAQTKAVKAAQKSHNLPSTGKLDPATIAAIELAYQQLPVDLQSRQPQSIVEIDRQERGYVVADAIANTNPRRAIALCSVPRYDGGIQAQVSVYCPLSHQGEDTLKCIEYVTLTGTPEAMTQSVNSIGSLTVPDLPKFLWWKATPSSDRELFQSIAPAMNSVIFDSAAFDNVETDLLALQQILDQGIPATDLNWQRLGVWQEIAAEAFDPPQRRQDIGEIDRVEVNYEMGNPAQALMFLGWLASRLAWEPTSYIHLGGEYDLRQVELTNSQGRKIQVELAGMPVADSGDIPGDLMAVRLDSSNPNAKCATVLCSEVAGCMQIEKGGKTQAAYVEEVRNTGDRNAEDLLAEYFPRWGQELLYEETMDVVAAILSHK
jgi:glucose-6-phosphate dehydrogenase assembly protein OpcA